MDCTAGLLRLTECISFLSGAPVSGPGPLRVPCERPRVVGSEEARGVGGWLDVGASLRGDGRCSHQKVLSGCLRSSVRFGLPMSAWPAPQDQLFPPRGSRSSAPVRLCQAHGVQRYLSGG